MDTVRLNLPEDRSEVPVSSLERETQVYQPYSLPYSGVFNYVLVSDNKGDYISQASQYQLVPSTNQMSLMHLGQGPFVLVSDKQT